MNLRVRLLLGYAYLLSLLLLAVGSSAFGFLHLGRGIDRILQENFHSIAASMRMVQALERQDSLTLVLLVDPQAAPDALEPFDAAFRQALEEAEGNITVDEERDLLRRIRKSYFDLRTAREALISEHPERPLKAYQSRVFPAFFEVQSDVLRLLEVNHQAMLEADREARRTAARHGAWLGFLAAVALLSLTLLSRAMHRGILARLQELDEVMVALAKGDRQRRLRVEGTDELALLARHVNGILDSQEELRGQMTGRLTQERQLVLAMISHLGAPVALLGLDASVIVDTLPDGSREDLEGLREWVSQLDRGRGLPTPARDRPDASEVSLETGRSFRLHLLAAHGNRPVAWLAEMTEPPVDSQRRRRPDAGGASRRVDP